MWNFTTFICRSVSQPVQNVTTSSGIICHSVLQEI
uniref:Uncharacterized protein n=1 Tax=Anguilla anguilla TaxID=7936 RepID=A0A0E9TJ22_ANGAN